MNRVSTNRDTRLSENPPQGEMLLFHENFAGTKTVPGNFFLTKSSAKSIFQKIYAFFWGEQASDIRYDDEKCLMYSTRVEYSYLWQNNRILMFLWNFVQTDTIKRKLNAFFFDASIPKRESLFIGGFVPMTTCEYKLELRKNSEQGLTIVQTPGAKIAIERKNTMDYVVDSFFMDTVKKLDYKRIIIPPKEGKLSLKIRFDGITKTTTITGNDHNAIVTPLYSLRSSQLNYPCFSNGYIKISNIALPYQDNSTVLIYSISQTAQRTLITPVGGKSILPFGLDGPHHYSTVKDGLSYMKKSGQRGTIWFDKEYMKNENSTPFFLALLLHESWEAGIHFSKSLTKLTSSEAYRLISDEYEYISSILHARPKTWCSLRNGDNVDFAKNVFDTYAMIWRNGEMGVQAEPGVGNLEDSSWEWWNLASRAGLIHPAFTHQTDPEPAIRYSISYSKFTQWVDNYQANGISIIPFHEWWQINANTNDTRITNISEGDNHRLRFKVTTNGGRALVNVHIPGNPDLKILDHTTRKRINWSYGLDNSVTFYVEPDHEYEISMPETMAPSP